VGDKGCGGLPRYAFARRLFASGRKEKRSDVSRSSYRRNKWLILFFIASSINRHTLEQPFASTLKGFICLRHYS
jgi:hypothetical protein